MIVTSYYAKCDGCGGVPVGDTYYGNVVDEITRLGWAVWVSDYGTVGRTECPSCFEDFVKGGEL